MFAVVEINDKQHFIKEGDIFTIDGIIESKTIVFKNILLIKGKTKTNIGQPYVKNATVEAEIIEAGKREKDIVFKFKRKTGYKVLKGHRQKSTLIKIKKINESETTKKAAETSQTKESKAKETEKEKPKAKKTTPKTTKKTTAKSNK